MTVAKIRFEEKAPAPMQDLPCYEELIHCIAAIWQRVCAWISQLFTEKVEYREFLSQSCPHGFHYVLKFLEPEEVALCETVCKSWKLTDEIWQKKASQYWVTAKPESGRFKDIFKVPKMAFGPREWIEHCWGDVGPMPKLPEDIHLQAASRKNTHTLTLIPATCNGEPFCLDTFVVLAKVSKVELRIDTDFPQDMRKESEAASRWIWMQKAADLGSENKNREQAEKDYPEQLGKTLWMVVSIVAHFARTNEMVFDRHFSPIDKTRARERRDVSYPIAPSKMFERSAYVEGIKLLRRVNVGWTEGIRIIGIAPTFLA